MRDALSGPPNPIRFLQGRFFSGSACMAHYCPMKGFIWIDATTGMAAGAVFGIKQDELKIGSVKMNLNAPPQEFITDLKLWLKSEEIRPLQFTALAEKSTFQIKETSIYLDLNSDVTISGPGFDCKKAQTKVEKTICSDEDLGKLDSVCPE